MIIIQETLNKLIEFALNSVDIELEAIYGHRQNITVNEETFINVLNHCKENYTFINEENTLDIRKKVIIKNQSKVGNIRCSIDGIYNIQKYCKSNKIEDESATYIIKKNIKDYPPVINDQYNYRINIKKEEKLSDGNEVYLDSFKNDIERAYKHYRFKKRYSFKFPNNLFRIDLTVVKSNKWNKVLNSYEFSKSFIESKILNEPEIYEIEIEFLGNNTIEGKKSINNFINFYNKKNQISTDYEPIDPGLNYKEKQDEMIQEIIGEYVFIKDSYLKNIEKSLSKIIKGNKISYVQDFIEEGNLTYAILTIDSDQDLFDQQLKVPISEIYNEDWNLDFSINESSKFKITDKLINSIRNEFNDNLYEILSIVNKTKLILTKDKKHEILNNYYKLTDQMSYKNKVFMAPQPITLNINQLNIDSPNNIINNYAVTEKADGSRYLLYIGKDKVGYLIDSKKNVIDTGILFPNIEGEWLLDGEYIENDKENKSIQLFMIFDVYYGTNESGDHPYKLPFVDRYNNKLSREIILKLFDIKYIKNMKIEREDYNIFRIYTKNYEYTEKPIDSSIEIDKSILFNSRKILSKNDSNMGYEYYTDGLIYLPLYLPVGANFDGVPKDKINGAWNLNYKWKPPEENTIDFKIITIKDKNGRDKKYSNTELDDEGNEVSYDYKKIRLIVSYDEKEDINLDYYYMILGKVKKNNIKLIEFNPPGESDNYNLTNIKLKNNKMICLKDNREFKDGDIVEMRFMELDEEYDQSTGHLWEPIKLRSDKKNPQWFIAANNVWSTLRYPVSTNMISGNVDLSTIKDYMPDKQITDLYYIENNPDDSSNLTSSCLRKLHNFIKSCLITGICKGKDVNIMDTSIGRGGDIKKYIQNEFNCKYLFGLDLNSINEASRRFYYNKNKTTDVVFLRYNTSKNIIEGEGVYGNEPDFGDLDIEHSESMINILYGLDKPLSKKYNLIKDKYNRLSLKKFDLISSQFSLHYYFESEETFNGFISNLVDNCKSGGYFIGTCYDGKKILELMKDYQSIEYKDDLNNLVYKITKKYETEDIDTNMFGNKIDVYMDSIGDEYTEYLVNFDNFTDIMKQNGFELQKPKMVEEYDIFDGPINGFGTIIEKLSGLKSNKNFMKFYKDSLKILKDDKLRLLSELNNYFIFKKI